LTITNLGNATLTVTGMTGTERLRRELDDRDDRGRGVTTGDDHLLTDSSTTYNGTLTVVANHTSGTNTISISGTGVSAAPAPTVFYVWGGPSYTQFLGHFSCLFCEEFDPDSINNPYGTYGSQFSPTSMRYQFGTYGSQFSNSSPCYEFASNPPRVYNSSRTVYYGELTLNQFRRDAIKDAAIVGWVQENICRH